MVAMSRFATPSNLSGAVNWMVAYRKLAFALLVDADAGEAAGIVGRKFVVRFLDREQVCGWIDRDDRCIGGSLDSDGFAAPSVANHVVDLVVACP